MPSETDVANFQATGVEDLSRHISRRKKIWVDLDNSPHVPFFRPIIEELRKRNYDVLITARNAYQVRELTDFYGVEAKMIGRHHGKHKILKALGTCLRVLKLSRILQFIMGRALVLASVLLRIPSVLLIDYEFTAILPGIKADLDAGSKSGATTADEKLVQNRASAAASSQGLRQIWLQAWGFSRRRAAC